MEARGRLRDGNTRGAPQSCGGAWRGKRDCNLQHHLYRTHIAVTASCRSSTRMQHAAFSRTTLWIVSQLMESRSFRQTYLFALLDVKSFVKVQNKELKNLPLIHHQNSVRFLTFGA